MQLVLELFRGEPAITEFDWNFSTIHNSSPSVARLVGSDLQGSLDPLHPGHGLLTRFRVMYLPPTPYSDLVSLCLPPIKSGLSSDIYTLAGSFFNRNTVIPTKSGLRLIVSIRFQKLFHRPLGLLFTFPSWYLFTIDYY